MTYSKGDIGWDILWNEDDTKFEFWEYHLRNVQNRKCEWGGNPIKWHYWTPKLKGVTWGKKSKKHGDFGWLFPNASQFTTKIAAATEKQFAKRKVQACRWELSNRKWSELSETQIDVLKRYIKRYG